MDPSAKQTVSIGACGTQE